MDKSIESLVDEYPKKPLALEYDIYAFNCKKKKERREKKKKGERSKQPHLLKLLGNLKKIKS